MLGRVAFRPLNLWRKGLIIVAKGLQNLCHLASRLWQIWSSHKLCPIGPNDAPSMGQLLQGFGV